MQRIQRPTIHDIAREAGVGTTTVSRVLNGGKLVAPAVRSRVENVIRELEYRPSHAARSLAQEKSRTIGLIVPRLTDPFFSTVASVTQNVCRANAHTLLISTSLDLEEQALEELKVFEQHRIDGVIIVPPPDQSTALKTYCRQLGRRVVALDLPVDPGAISCVQTNNRDATAIAVDHLLQHGRKRILFLDSDPRLHTMQERRSGYEQAMKDAKLRPMVREHVTSLDAAEAAILHAHGSKGGFDGLLTANSTLGIYAFQVMQKHRIPVPSRVSFISFDDFTLADTLRPSVTCISQPVEELSRIATELLFNQLQTLKSRTQSIQLPNKLILRESCGC